MVRIYHTLRLSDELNEYDLKIDDDEIIVYVSKDMVFEYKKPTKPNDNNQRIQKSLFNLKKSIIENNLFGVDINPNSVEICKLRLWIELLKNSYYLIDSADGFNANLDSRIHQMQTLPNIDINIKCGNSLVSYFDLRQSLAECPNIAVKIKDYKNAVADYKEGFFTSKKQIDKTINELNESFRNFLFHSKFAKEISAFRKKCNEYSAKYGDYLARDDKSLSPFIAQSFGIFDFDKESAKCDFEKLKRCYNTIFNLESQKPFEWRFVFPEVLDFKGDFMGFDLIIGNPPYMQVPKNIYSPKVFPYSEGKDRGKQNTYKVFIEQGYNLAVPKGEIWFVVQTSIMCDIGSKHTRELLLDNTKIHQVVELPEKIKIFTNVNQGVCIIGFNKDKPSKNHIFNISIDNSPETIENPIFEEVLQSNIKKFYPDNFEIPLIKKGDMDIIKKLKTIKSTLKDFITDSAQGNINTIHLNRIQSNKKTGIYLMKGENIKKYGFMGNFMNCIKTDETLKLLERNSKSHIIAMQGIHNINAKSRIHCTLLESKEASKFVFLHSTKMLFVKSKESAKYLVGLLNSKLLDWLFRKTSTNNNINIYELASLPIPKITAKNKKIADKVINLVDKVLELKASLQGESAHKEIIALESKIDDLVYRLYELDSREIETIKSK